MRETTPVKVGVIGCGTISGIYLKNAQWLKMIDVIAVADLRHEAAQARATEFQIPYVLTVEEMLAHPDIELILNLTNPNAHATVAQSVLEAGKSVYNEKPLTLSRENGQKILKLAQDKGLLVGCAPDTFLGGAHQACRHLIDNGIIGRPVAATAFMMGWGMEMWHPNPEFYFKPGGGPMLDMGPYYLTNLITLLGPVSRVTGINTIGRKQRTITSQPLAGTMIDVEVPTHVTGLLEFANGAVGTIITSFDVPGSMLPHIEIYGTKGTLSVPNPNNFGGTIQFKKPGYDEEWQTMPHTYCYTENSRGLGLADMAYSLRYGRPHRANGQLAYHVLDIMHAFQEAADQGQHITITSRCQRPAPLPPDLVEGELDSGRNGDKQ